MKRRARPRVSCLDPSFRYIPSHATDVRATFAEARKRMGGEQPQTIVHPMREAMREALQD